MIWRNRNFRKVFTAGIVILAVIFALPIFWPVDAGWYYRNLNWLIPLVIIMFIVPMVPFFLSDWDIHFGFEVDNKQLVFTLRNTGTTPFNFNRVQFTSGKRYWCLSKERLYPPQGMFGSDVQLHGADTPQRSLNRHTGCTLAKGMPITVILIGSEIPEYLRYFEKSKYKVYIYLYYSETKQRACSQRILVELVKKIIETSSGS